MKKCSRCDQEITMGAAAQCPICFKPFCENCAYRRSGRDFCSRFCAEYFFFGSDEDDEV